MHGQAAPARMRIQSYSVTQDSTLVFHGLGPTGDHYYLSQLLMVLRCVQEIVYKCREVFCCCCFVLLLFCFVFVFVGFCFWVCLGVFLFVFVCLGVFWCYFFLRLTHRPMTCESEKEEIRSTLPPRRHTRVKIEIITYFLFWALVGLHGHV